MRQIAAPILMGMMPVLLISSVWLQTYYANTRPEQPVADCGQAIPLNVHGTVVYLTRKEDLA
jgi:hypothetical protein